MDAASEPDGPPPAVAPAQADGLGAAPEPAAAPAQPEVQAVSNEDAIVEEVADNWDECWLPGASEDIPSPRDDPPAAPSSPAPADKKPIIDVKPIIDMPPRNEEANPVWEVRLPASPFSAAR